MFVVYKKANKPNIKQINRKKINIGGKYGKYKPKCSKCF